MLKFDISIRLLMHIQVNLVKCKIKYRCSWKSVVSQMWGFLITKCTCNQMNSCESESPFNLCFKSLTPCKWEKENPAEFVRQGLKFLAVKYENLWKSNAEGEIQYRLLYFLEFFFTHWKCHVVCFIFDSLWGLFDKLSGPFFPPFCCSPTSIKGLWYSISRAFYSSECRICDALLIPEGRICLSAWSGSHCWEKGDPLL